MQNEKCKMHNAKLKNITVRAMSGQQTLMVSAIASHTSDVIPGALFVAIRGTTRDGHALVDDAIARGAVAVVVERAVTVPKNIPCIEVADTRIALGQLAATFFEQPTEKMCVIGVTGTNGKTTLTYLLESIWKAANRVPGVMGTINYRFGNRVVPSTTTTPDAVTVQRICRAMCDAGVTDLVMEVSSHGLVQHRVDACQFDGAIFTNLTQDHLDYHTDMHDYLQAKRRLFSELLMASAKSTFAAVNAEDAASSALIAEYSGRVLRYGFASHCEVYPLQWHSDVSGITMQVRTPAGDIAIRSSLMGRFNVLNILAAIAAGCGMHLPLTQIARGVADVVRVPGRLERVPDTENITVVVDYAHTPDALENVLATMREIATARLITVFGCGGDRDAGKRVLMGRVAAAASDLVIVTSDNPRTEDPAAIVAQIARGVSADVAHEIVVDRRDAILRALTSAAPGDVVVIAGKGHEDYQIIGTEKFHFDDREIVQEFFVNRSV